MEEIKEVLREHLEECLKHFGRWFNSRYPVGKKGRRKATEPVAGFCGVHLNTIQGWLDNGGPIPKGETLIKLMCYLDLHGYKVIEFERLPRTLRYFAELIGFGLLSADEAAKRLGYKTTWSLYEVLSERQGASKEKESRMWDIWKERKGALEEKKKQIFKSGRLEALFEPATRPTLALVSGTPEQQVLALTSSVAEKDPSTRRLATLTIMRGLLLLLEDDFFVGLSEDDCRKLMIGGGGETILELSSSLSALSSRMLRLSASGKE